MTRGRNRGMYTGEKLDIKILGRLLSYVLKRYKFPIMIVLVCIVINARVQVIGSLFQRTLIDDYITPLMTAVDKNYGPLANKLIQMMGIYALGIIANFTYQKIMIRVTQGTMENIREDLFTHMETLPIRYFDTMRTVTSCRCIPTIQIPCARSYPRAFRSSSVPS